MKKWVDRQDIEHSDEPLLFNRERITVPITPRNVLEKGSKAFYHSSYQNTASDPEFGNDSHNFCEKEHDDIEHIFILSSN